MTKQALQQELEVMSRELAAVFDQVSAAERLADWLKVEETLVRIGRSLAKVLRQVIKTSDLAFEEGSADLEERVLNLLDPDVQAEGCGLVGGVLRFGGPRA